MKISIRIFLLNLLSAAGLFSAAFACDYHNQPGFGGFGPMGGFGAQSMGHQSLASPTSLQMVLSHDRSFDTKVNQDSSIDITYHLPIAYTEASIRFTHSKGLQLETTEDIEINEIDGTYTLDYVAKTPGEHYILVWAAATKQTLPFSKVQRIDISVE